MTTSTARKPAKRPATPVKRGAATKSRDVRQTAGEVAALPTRSIAQEAAEVRPIARRANRVVSRMTDWLGSLPAIGAAILVIFVWACTGPLLGFSDTWQLIINTFTTLVTFTMVFIIQNTQNRDGRAMQTKLDAQSEALVALCRKNGLEPIADRLSELTGVEDQPEKVIEEEQSEVRNAG